MSPRFRLCLWLSLAVTLAFGLEVVLWPQTPDRDMLDFVAAVIGYLALAAALLDLMQRERVRNAIGLLALAGIAALVAGLLIHPRTALADSPLTILSRMLGAPTAALFLMLTAWLALLRGRLVAELLLCALLAGGIWGLYGRWFPSAVNAAAGETPFSTLLMIALALLGLLAGLRWLLQETVDQFNASAQPVMLSPLGWFGVVAALAGLLVLRLAQGMIDPLALAIVVALILFTGVILRLYRHPRSVTLLEYALSAARLRPALLLAAALFVAAGAISYQLPRQAGDADPLGLLGTLLLAFGVAWLPALSMVIGGRALMREMQSEQF